MESLIGFNAGQRHNGPIAIRPREPHDRFHRRSPPTSTAARQAQADPTRRRRAALLAAPPCAAPAPSSWAAGSSTTRWKAPSCRSRRASRASKRGEPEAAVFTTAYQLERKSGDTKPRPVCFAFNGGPGSASIWLQLGALGPKRLRIANDGSMLPPPYEVEDNPLSWFEHFDLVFVDPPHTGYSITASDDARKKMLSVDGDVACLTDVIRQWLSRHQRWTSPIYVAGESYGTTRGAAIADKLADQGVSLAGLILISCAMDLQSIVFEAAQRPAVRAVPAGVRRRRPVSRLPQGAAVEVARGGARAGHRVRRVRLPARAAPRRAARATTSARRPPGASAELTGLSAALVEHRNLRISDNTFFTELLRDRGQIVGRLEARVAGPMGLSRTHEWDFDPGMESLVGPYTMAGMGYFIGTLGFDPVVALRGAVDGHQQALELEPRREAGQLVLLHQPRPVARAAPQPAPARARGQRPLRPRHAVHRQRLVAGPARHPRRRAPARHAPVLRRGPHDVHARRGPGQAEEGPRGLAGRERRPTSAQRTMRR